MSSEESAYHELCCYTLAHGALTFIHQHVVDAFAAQVADGHDKPIRLTFALVGLYLHVERGYSGRQVQLAHMALARRKRAWPVFPLPPDRGRITAADVLAVPEGPSRDEMIHEWCACVWGEFRASRQAVEDLLKESKVL
ncbi:DUF5946 family protein [Isosphaeraceae bacterium EP7]